MGNINVSALTDIYRVSHKPNWRCR